MLKEFKEFISKGNVMDLAIGVIIGAAFQAIINSLVNDMIMPLISMITGNVNFEEMTVTVGSATIKYGNFITAIVNFLIISLVIFLMIKAIRKMEKKNKEGLEKMSTSFEKYDKTGLLKRRNARKKKVAEAEPETKLCPFCYSEIPYKALKCGHCTSTLPELKEVKEEK